MELLGRLAQGGVVLLNKVPANLILGEVAVASRGVDGGGVLLSGELELVLLSKVAVGSHGFGWVRRNRWPGS